MSTKSTIAHGEAFHLYDEVIDGGIYLELDTDDVSLDYGKYLKQPRLRVRLPKALLDRLLLDGKPLVEQPGWVDTAHQEALDDSLAQDKADAARARRQKQLWRDSGLIGCFEGEEDLSTNYKQHIAEYLDKKYPQHKPPEE